MPPGLFLDQVLAFAKVELRAECDYRQEAAHQTKFRELMADEPDINVPAVVHELSTARILTSHLASGTW